MSATSTPEGKPLLICFEDAAACERHIAQVVALVAAREAVILTVWRPLASRLVAAGGFGGITLQDEAGVDEQELAAAQGAAQRVAAYSAAGGFEPEVRVEQAVGPAWQTIIDVADEIDAALIVCGGRGASELAAVVLGSTSHALLHHAKRPVLVIPESADAG